MNILSKSSRIAADELRRAEHSIVRATRDTAQLLVTTCDITEGHGLAPGSIHATAKATVNALSALVESQHHLGVRAHLAIEKAGKALGLTETDWGAGDPKPAAGIEPEHASA
ncbi:hypothetical protein QE385_003231 [Sphingomonas sp. SORGH_AS 950]|uniref:hypothetical protein n=1 Tax=Sphingomonas sp. SORGH_AS_0950 TaxID=3041792 RepID=UPI0027844C61|nr:hypothetical protein [Sphingomonas sp. SORGH_AS_0950]MDQ1158904.1 hypothetical protein [Sphingomonas sp. SORGH_AS_0950]